MIENTGMRDPMLNVLGAIGGTDRYITEMEADGQRQMVNSDRLPVKGPDDELRALGFVLGEPDPTDPLFRPVTMPEGWTREGTGHDMWSSIVDRNGRERVRVFYKAAFYDRRASCSVVSIAAYVAGLVFEDQMPAPIIDEWTTREALIDAATIGRQEVLADAAEWASGSAPAERYEKRAQRYGELLAAIHATAEEYDSNG